MKTNKIKLAKEGMDRMFQFWNPYIDQLEKETQQAIDGGYLEHMFDKCRAIQQHPFIQDLVTMKSRIEDPDGHLEYKEFGFFDPEYCKLSIKYWQDELSKYQKGIANKKNKV